MENQKAAKPTTLFMAILDVHKKELFLKGYSEVMMGSFSQPGQFVKQLQESFFEAYVNNILKYNLARFQLEISGFFKDARNKLGNAKDKVSFQFDYAFDPKKIALTLNTLKATMNEDVIKVYDFENKTYHLLPAAESVHKEICKIRDLQIIQAAHQQKKPMPNKRLPKR